MLSLSAEDAQILVARIDGLHRLERQPVPHEPPVAQQANFPTRSRVVRLVIQRLLQELLVRECILEEVPSFLEALFTVGTAAKLAVTHLLYGVEFFLARQTVS